LVVVVDVQDDLLDLRVGIGAYSVTSDLVVLVQWVARGVICTSAAARAVRVSKSLLLRACRGRYVSARHARASDGEGRCARAVAHIPPVVVVLRRRGRWWGRSLRPCFKYYSLGFGRRHDLSPFE